MHRTAATAAALVMLTAAPALAQSPQLEALLGRWKGCVVQSYQAQRPATPDASMAVETAFAACQTEENGLFMSGGLSPQDEYRYRALYRMKLKSMLVSAR